MNHLITRLRRKKFDAAIISTTFSLSPFPAAMLTHMAAIPPRAAFTRQKPYDLLTQWIKEKEPDQLIRHEVDRQLTLIEILGNPRPNDEKISIRIPVSAYYSAERKLQKLGVNPKKPYVIGLLKKTMNQQHCGFVGSPVISLSYIHDLRPKEHHIEFWEDKVTPEKVTLQSSAWQRFHLHNAANPYHIAQQFNITIHNPKIYKVAWVGGCVMYNTKKLRYIGGFSFWKELQPQHSGEDVLAQLKVMAQFGGCGILPSGVYHQELPTTIKNKTVDAPKALPIE